MFYTGVSVTHKQNLKFTVFQQGGITKCQLWGFLYQKFCNNTLVLAYLLAGLAGNGKIIFDSNQDT